MGRGEAGESDHHDVLIVGAGLSGVGAAARLRQRCPGKSFLLLEARERIGGTWDLFRYPGIRSDSDMYTLGFPFRPWRGDQAIAGGEAIRDYIEDTADACTITPQIRFGHRVVRASWSGEASRWTVEAETESGPRRFTAAFLFLASGYYDYAQGFRPEWPGEQDFAGRIVHPQFWPDDLDVAGKRVVVIGSGATAVTLVPALAESAAHVTMLQRSPSFIAARPSRDGIARRLQRVLPPRAAAAAVKWKNVLLGIWFFGLARRRPDKVRRKLLELAKQDLPPGYDVERHLNPTYNVWDQRLCLAPDGDLFTAIRAGTVSIATGAIERFTKNGVRLENGEDIAADLIVTATGLVVRLFGGMQLAVDGAPVEPAERLVYKGMMLSGVPNLALFFGYTNASWTLKSDLSARYACRLLNHMDARGLSVCTPVLPDGDIERLPMLQFTSGYVRRALPSLPSQGPVPPWRVHQNYLKDLAVMRFGKVDDGVMAFE
ncbi:MAG: flavin-containing monooxygenase [Sphingosinicella sp.]